MSDLLLTRELKPLHNVYEYLTAPHISTEEARQWKCRLVEAHHFCSRMRKGKHIGLW